MKNNLCRFIFITILYFLSANENLNAQAHGSADTSRAFNSPDSLGETPDSLGSGIPISEVEFDLRIKRYVVIMEKGETIKTVDDLIIIVRLVNTIAYEEPSSATKLYMHFLDLFEKHYLNPAINSLEAHKSRGGGYYSPKYKIAIGGPPPRNRDFYHILKK